LVVSERFLRQTIGSPGISGDFQITFSSFSFSGAEVFSLSRFSVLLVATSTCLLATASALVSCPALTVRLKSLAEMLFLAKT
jgi:hypothetical protein